MSYRARSLSADYLSSNIFRWTSDQGFVELATAPIVAGLALPEPLLSDDGAVLFGTLSADGRGLVGMGRCGGKQAAFRAALPE